MSDKPKSIPILSGKEHTGKVAAQTATLKDLDRQFNDPSLPESKDVTMVKSMMAYARARPQKNLSDIKIEHDVTRKTHIAFVMMPKWAVYFAPYHVARLAAVTRAAGYRTTVKDYNVDAWNRLRDPDIPPGEDEDDFWYGHGSRDYLWIDEMYENRVRPRLQPLLDEYLEEIVALQPDVVGFSMYYTSVLPTFWMAEQLKKRLPGVKILGGGSQIQWADENNYGRYPNFDHVVKGEAEELILEILGKIENNEPLTQYQYNSDFARRINLDTLPFPDYSDMDVNRYMIPNAISAEISRGCVAKCAFCAETLFWKYRSRQAPRILDEIEQQYNTYGTNIVWFIDSLVNGNVDELRAFALGVVERGMKIRWKGYCRCDDRMDFEYLKDLADSGCDDLNFGIESGSEPVLNAMKKNTTVPVIERNLKDCHTLGITCTTNWMLGFPGEMTTDFARTMTLAWRNQKYIASMARQAMNLGPSRVQNDPGKYGVHPKHFLGNWATMDHSNTKIHRLIRVKSFNILTEHMPVYSRFDQDHNRRLTQTYDFDLDCGTPVTKETLDEFTDIPYEDFDYNIIQDPGLNTPFKQTVVNEIWALFRTLWRSRKKGAMKMGVRFEPKWDYNTHGSGLSGDDFTATYEFEINDSGEWTASARVVFNAPENPYGPYYIPDEGEIVDYDIDLDWQGTGRWD